MALSLNDLETKARQIAYVAVADSPDDATVTGACRLMGVVISAGAAAAAHAIVNDALTTGGGGTSVQVNAIFANSRQIDFGPNGIAFSTGISVVVSGALSSAMITYVLT